MGDLACQGGGAYGDRSGLVGEKPTSLGLSEGGDGELSERSSAKQINICEVQRNVEE